MPLTHPLDNLCPETCDEILGFTREFASLGTTLNGKQYMTSTYSHTAFALSTFIALSLSAPSGQAQTTHTPASATSTHATGPTDASQLQRELAVLREQVKSLESRVSSQNAMGKTQNGIMAMQSSMPSMPAMKMGDDDDMPMNMKMPSAGSMKGGCMMDDMMGMGAMGGANSATAMAIPSSLPGFPGQSHLYHLGSSDFFLDHESHISLTNQQQKSLAKIKQASLAQQADVQRQIDAAEEELWSLTAADQPDAGEVEKKARAIERLRSDKRLAFIRKVGEASKLLTDEQRLALTGMAPSESAPMPMNSDPKPKDMGHM